MQQVLTASESLQVTAANTSLTTFASVPGRLIYLQADSNNVGRVQIIGLTGTAGISLGAGDFHPTIYADNLNKLRYQAATANDKINVLVLR